MLSKIRACALNLLARREHSTTELERKLISRGFAADMVVKIIQELGAKGLQSNERFIEGYVNMRSRRGFGPLRIQAELSARGIDKDEGERFLRAHGPIWSELASITRCKKFGEQIPGDLHERSRQIRYLLYKGFTSEHMKDIL